MELTRALVRQVAGICYQALRVTRESCTLGAERENIRKDAKKHAAPAMPYTQTAILILHNSRWRLVTFI